MISREFLASAAVNGFHSGQMRLAAPKIGTLIPNRIFVGGISANTTEQELRTFFSTFGTVKDVKVIIDKTGLFKGSYGFVTFESREIAESLIKNDSESLIFKERKLNIGYAVRKQHVFSKQGYGNTMLLPPNGYSLINGITLHPVCAHDCRFITMAQPTVCCPTTILVPQCEFNQYGNTNAMLFVDPDKTPSTSTTPKPNDNKFPMQIGENIGNNSSSQTRYSNFDTINPSSTSVPCQSFIWPVSSPAQSVKQNDPKPYSQSSNTLCTLTPSFPIYMGSCSHIPGSQIDYMPCLVNPPSQDYVPYSAQTTEVSVSDSDKINFHGLKQKPNCENQGINEGCESTKTAPHKSEYVHSFQYSQSKVNQLSNSMLPEKLPYISVNNQIPSRNVTITQDTQAAPSDGMKSNLKRFQEMQLLSGSAIKGFSSEVPKITPDLSTNYIDESASTDAVPTEPSTVIPKSTLSWNIPNELCDSFKILNNQEGVNRPLYTGEASNNSCAFNPVATRKSDLYMTNCRSSSDLHKETKQGTKNALFVTQDCLFGAGHYLNMDAKEQNKPSKLQTIQHIVAGDQLFEDKTFEKNHDLQQYSYYNNLSEQYHNNKQNSYEGIYSQIWLSKLESQVANYPSSENVNKPSFMFHGTSPNKSTEISKDSSSNSNVQNLFDYTLKHRSSENSLNVDKSFASIYTNPYKLNEKILMSKQDNYEQDFYDELIGLRNEN